MWVVRHKKKIIIAIAALLLLFVTGLGLLTHHKVRSKVVRYWAKSFSEKYGVKLDLNQLDISWRSVHVKGIYIEDHHQDTLLYIGSLKCNLFDWYQVTNNPAKLSGVSLDKAVFHLKKYPKEKMTNLDIWIKKAFPTDTTTTDVSIQTAPPFTLKVDEIQLNDTEVVSINHRLKNPIEAGYYGIKGTVRDFMVKGATISGRAENLSCKDHWGIEYEKIKSDYYYGLTEMRFDNSHVKTKYSEIEMDMRFDFPKATLRNFKNSVQIIVETKKAVLDIRDLQKFYPKFGDDHQFYGHFSTSGTLNDFKINVGHLEATDEHFDLAGFYRMKNIFDAGKKFRLIAKNLHLKTDINNSQAIITDIPNNAFTDLLAKMGRFHVKGKKLRLRSDKSIEFAFQATTDLGDIGGNLTLNNLNDSKHLSYKGSLYTQRLKLPKLTHNPLMGHLTMSGMLNGQGISINTLDTHFKGTVSEYQYKGYPYQHIAVDGRFRQRRFDGKLSIKDPNIELDFSGFTDHTNPKKNLMNFEANVKKANFKALHLYQRDSIAVLSGNIKCNLQGNQIDEMVGTVAFENGQYQNEHQTFKYDNGKLSIQEINNDKTIIVDAPKIAQGIIKGTFKISELPWLLLNGFGDGLNNFKPYPVSPHQKFDLNLQLKNKLITAFIHDLKPRGSINIKSEFEQESEKPKVKFTLKSKKIHWNNVVLDSIVANIDNQNPNVNTRFHIGKITSPKYEFQHLDLFSKKVNDTLWFRSDFTGEKTQKDRYGVDFYYALDSLAQSVIGIEEANLHFKGKDWIIKKQQKSDNQLTFNLEEQKFSLAKTLIRKKNNPNSFSIISGIVNDRKQDLNFQLSNIKIEELIPSFDNFSIAGNINGNYHHLKEKTNYQSEGILSLANLKINDKLQGKMDIKLESTGNQYNYGLQIFLSKVNRPKLAVQGFVFYENREMELDLFANLSNFELDFINLFSGDVLNFEGQSSGNLLITGLVDKPKIIGSVTLNQAKIGIPLLNTQYRLKNNSPIDFQEQAILFSENQINDTAYNTTGILDGQISFSDLFNWYADLTVNSKRLLSLNTNADNDERPYYGKVFLSGNASFKGAFESLLIDAKVNTLKDTDFFVSAEYDFEEVNRSELINFKKKDTLEKLDFNFPNEVNSPDDENANFSMNLDITATKNAKATMVIDKVFGSYVKVNGNGKLNITMNPKEDLKINGDYTITKGTYNLAYKGFINKSFEIKTGSQINWSGDPYNAHFNIEAFHRVKANPSTLFQGVKSRNKINVDLIANMEGTLLENNQKFNINIPDAGSVLKSELDFKLNNEGEKMRQFFSLLLYKSFYNTNATGQESEFLRGTTSDILSRAISEVINSSDNFFQIGLGYVSGAQTNINNPNNINEQLNILVNSDIGERLSIYGSLGVPIGRNRDNANLIGSLNVSYDIDPKGHFKWYLFNRPNNIEYTQEEEGYTRGTGFSYQINFSNIKNLIQQLRRKKKTKDKVPTKKTP